VNSEESAAAELNVTEAQSCWAQRVKRILPRRCIEADVSKRHRAPSVAISIPVSIIRRRAQLPAPLPGQPGPFSLGAPGLLEAAYRKAGFRDIQVRVVPSPLRLSSAAECVRLERESFGALHQMLAGVPEAERPSVWAEIEDALSNFEDSSAFVGPCEMLVGVGAK